MNRRNFLKLSAVTSSGMLVPVLPFNESTKRDTDRYNKHPPIQEKNKLFAKLIVTTDVGEVKFLMLCEEIITEENYYLDTAHEFTFTATKECLIKKLETVLPEKVQKGFASFGLKKIKLAMPIPFTPKLQPGDSCTFTFPDKVIHIA